MNYLKALGELKVSTLYQIRHIAINTGVDDCEIVKDLIVLIKE